MSGIVEHKRIRIGDLELKVEIADNLILQTRGLSNRDNLDENTGMLFVYDNNKIRHFWMKEVQFPLDVLWIADGVVMAVQENIPFESDNDDILRFKSNIPVNWVLEVNAGFIAKNGLKIGDTVDMMKD